MHNQVPTRREVVSTLAALSVSGAAFRALGADERRADTVVIPAADLAPSDLRAAAPTPARWWLRRDIDGVNGGAILVTGKVEEKQVPKDKLGEWEVPSADLYATPYRVPALTIDPKVRGWHRITVGLLNRQGTNNDYLLQPRLWGKLSGDPYPEFLLAPQGAKGTVVETDWRLADLTGQTIRIEQAPAPMQYPGRGWIGGIAYLKLTPLTDAEVAAARKEETLPPIDKRLFGLLDTPDEIFWWGTVESLDDWKAVIWRHERAGFGRVYLRCWGSHLDSSVAIPDANPRWSEADDKAWRDKQGCPVGWRPYLDLPKKFDLLKVASDYAKQLGIEVHGWVRFTNLNRPPYAEFWHKHPEYIALRLGKDGKTLSKYARVLSLAHPEVRAFYVSFFKQLASTGTPGILIDLLRHPPLAGFEPASQALFKKKFGIELMSLVKPGEDPVALLLKHPQVQELHQELLTTFLRDLRQEIGPKIEIGVRSRGPDAFGLRGKAMIDAGLVNTIMDGNWYSNNLPRPTIDATLAAAGTKGRGFAIAEPGNVDPKTYARKSGTLEPDAILALARHYKAKGVHGYGLYESTEFEWRPELRRAVRAAGWVMAQ